MNSLYSAALASLVPMFLLGGCIDNIDGKGSGNEQVTAESGNEVLLNVAGIKGPLAFADTNIFAFDPNFPALYNENSPIASTISSQFADIQGLSVPGNIRPPYILTIGGPDAIDLNTGVAPVIGTLIIVITQDMLDDRLPIYASPLTTLVYHMARIGAGSSPDVTTFTQLLESSSTLVGNTFSIDPDVSIDVLRSPLVINANTVTTAQQKEAVYHRAALEAFAAEVYTLAASQQNITADNIIVRLALDLQSDGTINNSANGVSVGAIDPTIFNQDPISLSIPNTPYQVADIISLMEDERVLMGTANTTTFNKNQIALPTPQNTTQPTPVVKAPVPSTTAPTSSTTSTTAPTSNTTVTPVTFPVNLRGSAPESATVEVTVSKPTGAVNADIILMTYDADSGNEGQLIINGNAPIQLFGAAGVAGNDSQWTEITVTSPAGYWKDGSNSLVFMHTNTNGFEIERATVSFRSSSSSAPASPTTTTRTPPASSPVTSQQTANALLSVNFEDIDRGGASAVRYTASKMEADFNWNMHGYTSGNGGNNYFGPLNARGGSNYDSVWIVPDPAGNNTGRGNVLRVTHLPKAWGGNASGTSWRADFEPQDEVYFAYDIYLSPGDWYSLQEKLPGVIAGTMLEASHPGDAPPSVDDPWRGVSAFTNLMQLHSDEAYGRGDGSLATYYYDNDRVQRSDWLNTADPASGDKSSQYLMPRGVWVTIELHVKMNAADIDPAYDKSVDLKDGLSEVWIDGVLMSRQHHSWRKWQQLKADGLWIYDIYGGNGEDPRNIPPKTMYTYFDQFMVSNSRITGPVATAPSVNDTTGKNGLSNPEGR